MREIKFRAKRIDNGEWAYGDLVHCCPGDCYIGSIGAIAGRDIKFNGEICDLKTVGQYTGLKDKNDKEIYEGDIIIARERSDTAPFKGYVHYINAQYFVSFIGYESYYRPLINLHGAEYEPIEVVGNIYEKAAMES